LPCQEVTIIGKFSRENQKNKINLRRDVQHLSGVQCCQCPGQADTRTISYKVLAIGRDQKNSQRIFSGSPVEQEKKKRTKTICDSRSISISLPGTGADEGRPLCCRTRISLVKKKSELGLKGPLKGHFSKEIKKSVVEAIQAAITNGLKQNQACALMEISPRKFRKWLNPKQITSRTAWNKILPKERAALIKTALHQDFWGKPISHLFVHGHETGKYHLSMTTIYHILREENLERNIPRRKRKKAYIGVPELLEQGFSLLCYDGTVFITETRIKVWAIPVMLLPFRYLLHIGYSINGVASKNLTNSIDEALIDIPEDIKQMLMTHSDRGSAMKSKITRKYLEDKLGIPIHYGRPKTPDDEAWIEALIKTFKYHRDAPLNYRQVDDVIQWLKRFPKIYNNEPHSALQYVTPTQALLGQKEVILAERQKNLLTSRKKRLDYYHKQKLKLNSPEE